MFIRLGVLCFILFSAISYLPSELLGMDHLVPIVCNEKEVGTFEPTSLLKENIFLYTFFFDTGFLASKFA